MSGAADSVVVDEAVVRRHSVHHEKPVRSLALQGAHHAYNERILPVREAP